MAKKKVSKTSKLDSSGFTKSEKPKKKKMTAREREELLVENFVGIQKAMTNLSIKFEEMSDNIVKLLQVFEESAKDVVSSGKQDNTQLIDKINSLLDQNKTIAQGIVLIESKLRNAPSPRHEQSSQDENQGIGKIRPRPWPKSE